jgi:hypothetical protein
MTAPLIVAILFGASLGLAVLVALLTPGRKGSMRTQRSIVVPGATVEEVAETYTARLEYEGFRVWTRSPGQLDAKRADAAAGKPLPAYAHADKALNATVTMVQEGPDVHLTLTLWTPDFVLMDTGEGQHIDMMLDRLLDADLVAQPRPVVPNPSFNAVVALYHSGLMCATPLLLLHPTLGEGHGRTVLHGVALSWFLTAGWGLTAIYEVHRKPGAIHGGRKAVTAIALGAAAVLFAGVLFKTFYPQATLLAP